MNENFDEYRKEVYDDIAASFRWLRKTKGLTVEEAAAAAKMTPAKVEAIERGNLPHNVHHLTRLAEAMGGHLALMVKPDESWDGLMIRVHELNQGNIDHCPTLNFNRSHS